MVIALTGRRIDSGDLEARRFPLEHVPIVERRLDGLFERLSARQLISSAACGADLVALTVAGRRGMRRRVVLPFSAEKFRATSVVDRPGDWGPVYDRLLAELAPTNDVVALKSASEGNEAYVAANAAILEEAAMLGRDSTAEVVAVLVWEGAPQGEDDVTAAFGDQARRRGWRVEHVKTM
jgi:hypothetical protein